MNKALAVIGLITVVISSAQATIITQWNFNDGDTGNFPGGVNSPSPSIGEGQALAVGNVTLDRISGIGSSDPEVIDLNRAWGARGYDPFEVAQGLAGVEFRVSTMGFENIRLKLDQNKDPRSLRFSQIEVSVGGIVYTPVALIDGSLVNRPDFWFNSLDFDLSGVPGVSNNSQIGIRIVSVFPEESSVGGGDDWETSAGVYYDQVTIYSEAVPEPVSVLGLAGLALAGLVRRKRC